MLTPRRPTSEMTISALVLAITGSRVLFAAAFAGAALEGHDALLLPLAVLIEMSDMTDGFVARRTGTSSDVGTVYDGMADLIARMTEFICLAAIGAIAVVPVLVFLWREGLVITAQRVASDTGARVRYGRIGGKLKGVTQGACLLWLAASESVPSISNATGQWATSLFVWLAVTVTVLSGIDYLLVHRGALRASVAARDTTTG
jgi:CDP-diacylglycerol---glycerol-3-phosphate 3-phosphatidyltransferase